MLFQTWSAGDQALAAADGDVAEARRQIAAAHLDGGAQEALRHRLLDFCVEHDDCLDRSGVVGHLTGSALVVEPGRGLSLLIHHAKLDRWLQPGGHADGDGNLGAVAWREATEETGLDGLVLMTPAIDLDVHRIPMRKGEPAHLHFDVRFLVLAPAGGVLAPNHETLGARWMSGDDPVIERGSELHRAVKRALHCADRLPGQR